MRQQQQQQQQKFAIRRLQRSMTYTLQMCILCSKGYQQTGQKQPYVLTQQHQTPYCSASAKATARTPTQ
jgi:hypothetical protein